MPSANLCIFHYNGFITVLLNKVKYENVSSNNGLVVSFYFSIANTR